MTTPDTATTPSPTHAPSRARHWILGFILLILGAAAVWYWGGEAAPPPQARNPFFGPRGPNFATPVRAAEVRRENIDVQIRALGTVTPLNTVTVRSRLDGELIRVLFTEGQMVREGQLLAEIDPRPYEVALAQAEGQLRENEARLKNAEGDLERYRKLAEEGLITQQQVTTQEALVQQYRGALQANQAAVNNARLQLQYTRIVAPISGRLGLRQVDPGNLIRSSDPNGLVVITQVKPISVIFTVPEAEFQAVLTGLRERREMPVEAWDRGDAEKLADGVLRAVDNQIDTTTGTIKLRATFTNDDERLFPNQFVNVRLRVQTIRDATVIPSAAVQRASFGTFVYVIDPDTSTVSIRRVTLGPAQDTRVSITEGLEPGELIVLEGVDDLTDGAKVEVIPDGAPGRDSRPAAAESASPAGAESRPAGRRP